VTEEARLILSFWNTSEFYWQKQASDLQTRSFDGGKGVACGWDDLSLTQQSQWLVIV
jgi:hypothetical protein